MAPGVSWSPTERFFDPVAFESARLPPIPSIERTRNGMPLEQPSLRSLLERRIVVRPVVRVILAVTVIAGGLAFAALGALVFFAKPSVPHSNPVGMGLLSIVMALAGLGFLWLGMRLISARTASNNLLSPSARRWCSLLVGGLAACMWVLALDARSPLFLIVAAGLVVFSYFLFPLARH